MKQILMMIGAKKKRLETYLRAKLVSKIYSSRVCFVFDAAFV